MIDKIQNLDDALRILKKKGILKSNVALELGIDNSYLSKLIKSNSMTRKNQDKFNDLYGKYVILDLPQQEDPSNTELALDYLLGENQGATPSKAVTAEAALLKTLIEEFVKIKSEITKEDAKSILLDLEKRASEYVKAHS